MIQKITWMRYLLIGISVSVLLFLNGCTKKNIDYRVRSKWIFINETSHSITYKPAGYWEEYNIKPNGTSIIYEDYEGPKIVEAKNYLPPLNAEKVVFDGTKCSDLSAQGLNKIENYESKKLGERYYEFTYRFTEADYQKATDCP